MSDHLIPRVTEPISCVKSPTLPPNVESVLHQTYPRRAGLKSVDTLSQGELDILEAARVELGWPSVISLAHKYYPLYPHRKCWQRALEKCRLKKLRTRTLNIKYLLLAVISQVKYSLQANFSGRGSLNRLVQRSKTKGNIGDNRLVAGSGVMNADHVSGILPPLLRHHCSLVTAL